MFQKTAITLSLLAAFTSACRKPSVNCGVACDYPEELMFQTGFNNATLADGEHQDAFLEGTDNQWAAPNDWTTFANHASIGSLQITYEDGDNTQRYCQLVPNPNGVIGDTVMEFRLMQAHINEGTHKKGRVQLDLMDNNCLREIYQKVRLQLDADFNFLRTWSEKVDWLTLFEFWNNADWTKEKHAFRVSVNLFKQAGDTSALHFHVKGDKKPNCYACKWQKVWEQEQTNFSVPIGEWMDVELYLKEGDEQTGRFYMAITPQNGSKQIIFDIYNYTQHPNEDCPDGFTNFQPMKIYTSQQLIDYMNNNNKRLSVYWDNWQLYRNKTL